MQPLFYQLASSLNVELVYVILKSITQYTYACKETPDGKKTTQKKTVDLQVDRSTGDASLCLKRIKIKNQSAWSRQTTSDK